MSSLSIPALRCGGPANLPQSHVLRAGPFSMLFEQGELRRIRLGDREVIRRIYVTVRGPDWSTIPADIQDLSISREAEAFVVFYRAVYKQGDIDFTWTVGIRGNADGEIRWEAAGKSESAFATNRVGICVLHPLRECAGMPALVRGVDNSVLEGRFPESIEPHQPFLAFQEIAHVVEKEWLALVKLEGETFEMEDQRNWTDGSFKTYCPPQSQPKPRRIEAGWETLQIASVMLQNPEGKPVSDLVAVLALAEAAKSAAEAAKSAAEAGKPVSPQTGIGSSAASESTFAPVLKPETGKGHVVPAIGFGLPSHGQAMDPEDIRRLKDLAPFHLRADFRLSQPGFREELTRAAAEAAALSLPLEVALILPADGNATLEEFARAWQDCGAEAVRWLIFSETADATTDGDMAAARESLGPLDPLASFARGSKGDFVLLNRNRPASHPGMSLAYAMCPQVHLTDNRTLVESLEGQAYAGLTVAATWKRSSAIATPITLKRSPLALSLKKPPTRDPGPAAGTAWRNQVDTRQFSLFGAGWTLGSLKRIALSGVNSATYYETTGLLGVMSGRGLPGEMLKSPAFDFALSPGWVYPMYHVFADFAGFVGGNAYEVRSDMPLRYDAVLLHAGDKASLLIANLEETPGKVRLIELGNVGGIRRLNEGNAMRAMEDPEGYRAQPFEPFPGNDDGWELQMQPFEYVRIDLTAG